MHTPKSPCELRAVRRPLAPYGVFIFPRAVNDRPYKFYRKLV